MVQESPKSMECDYDHGSIFYFALNQTAEERCSYILNWKKVSVYKRALRTPLANSTPEENTPEVSISSWIIWNLSFPSGKDAVELHTEFLKTREE